MENSIKKVIVHIIMHAIVFIRALFLIPHGTCKYHPTCTVYAKEAFLALPFFKAIFVILKRILRCNPFSNGGYDPVVK